MSESIPLYIWTVYDNPIDFPGKFVVRRFRVTEDGAQAENRPWSVKDTLEEARRAIPPGLVCMSRSLLDDAKVVETWL